jgi:hypothetical protein
MFAKLAQFQALGSSRVAPAPRRFVHSNDNWPSARPWAGPISTADPGVPLAIRRERCPARMPLERRARRRDPGRRAAKTSDDRSLW